MSDRRHLTAADATAVLDTVWQLNDACSVDELFRRTVAALATLVDCDTVSLTAVDSTTGTVDDHDHPTGALAGCSTLLAARLDEHPGITHYLRTDDRGIRSISELAGRRAWRATGLYAELFGPLGIDDQLLLAIDVAGPVGLGAGLNRSRPGFTDRERARLELLRPHLAQAYRRLRPPAPPPGLTALTAREREVLTLVAEGLSDRQVARRLGVSTRTVHKHLEHCYRKLDTDNRTAAAALLRAAGAGTGTAPVEPVGTIPAQAGRDTACISV